MRSSAALSGAGRPATAAGRRAHGARQIGLGQRQVVEASPIGREQRVVRGVDPRVQLRQLVLVVEARDHQRARGVDVLDRAVGAADLLVADAGLGLEDLVVGLLLLEAERRRRRAIALVLQRQQAPPEALDVLRGLPLGILGDQRPVAPRRQPDRLVRLDVTEIVEGVPEPPSRRRRRSSRRA